MKKKNVQETEANMNEELEPEISKGKRVANAIINVILVLAIILAAICTYISYVSTSGNGVPSILGIRIFSIQTESMYPTLKPGDLIFDRAVDTSALEVDDIITYWTVIDGERVLNTHRITQIYDGGGYLIFETKGDNNTVADALTVHESEIVGQYKGAKLDGVGKVFDYLQTSTGFLIVVVIPVAIFFLYHLIQFFRVLFEYNNIKNKLAYEMERGKTEEIMEEEKKKQDELRKQERARLEGELRDKLRAELLAANAAQVAPAKETAAAQAAATVAEEPKTEAPVEESVEAQVAPAVAEEPKTEAPKAEASVKENEASQAEPSAEAPKATAPVETPHQETREEMTARIRAEMEAEAKAKAEEEARAKAKAEEEAKARAAMEAEIRAQILAEMQAQAKETQTTETQNTKESNEIVAEA
jgi:signal peptidase